ncbi:hydroxyphenylacetyl-CoA thioesterase PaaI [Massilia atriviolacea]|uniref:Hydroxyphenylacetyl-CoA thioesterase PaaI n=1 Tax=Massilia atriviolacea TaxID=2495579 RepID=A0A430HGQ3_9BURK|nr:hydroxyphenylacetyl-CoA thioesterase PaaI [Massilia atriviolacea]RSZ56708.1 hydroxyphenylacetyl-CoA thioesterase PaaI [Massilia atriviolacea]
MHIDPHAPDPQALAELAGKTMFERDPASQALGMLLAEIRPGYARMTMPVRGDMLNGHQTCHGGYIFMLADSAFAFACNSHNLNTVGAGCTIDYLAPGREGDLLTATALEQALSGKTGVYDITVTNQDGRMVALFRGKSHRVAGNVAELPLMSSLPHLP